MNLVTFVIPCLMILVQQAIGQDEAYQKFSCENEDIKQHILDKHNELRARVNPSPSNMLALEWDDEAAANALRWAKVCGQCHSTADEREITEFGCGENLYMSNRLHNWTRVIQGWYDECKNFKYGYGPTSKGAVTGHFTQVIWYRTFKIGCALAYCAKKEMIYFYVCQYCPAGNVKNSLYTPYKAGENCADCPNHCKNGLCVNPCRRYEEYEECKEYKELCDASEEDMPEEHRIKTICPETCYCDTEIH